MRSRINRLEALQAEIMAHSAILAQEEGKELEAFLEKSLTDTYYKGMYDEYINKNPEALDLMANNNVKLASQSVNKLLALPWSGDNYSSNIWRNSYFIAKKAQALVAKNIIAGRSIDNLTNDFAKVYGNNYRANIRRLLRTETAYVKSQGDVEVYKKLGVEEYEILATLDSRTSAICQEKDGKHYPIDEISVGINYPPFHPNCRTTTIKYNPDYEGRTRMAKNKDGKNVKVPFGMKYEEWKKWVENPEKGYNTTNIRDKDVIETPSKTDDENFNWLLDRLLNNNIEYLPVKELKQKKVQIDIIEDISGGDRTSGSCASLGLAYIGQRKGYDVLDYRGGASLDLYSRVSTLHKVAKIKGIKSSFGEYKGTVPAANNLLKSIEVGKEYYLCAGRHASIVRKLEDERYQYLELQSATNSGWIDFNGNPRYTLSQRFGCSGSNGEFAFIIDIDESDFKTEEFRSLLGFINTKAEDQVKGSGGYEK